MHELACLAVLTVSVLEEPANSAATSFTVALRGRPLIFTLVPLPLLLLLLLLLLLNQFLLGGSD